jgi:hypothetical protein
MNEDSGHNLRDMYEIEKRSLIKEFYEDHQRKLIVEFLDYVFGTQEENQKDWSSDFYLKPLGSTREKLIDDFFNSRK